MEIHEGGRSVEVCWVPAPVGILNNERADEGARSAAESDAPISDPAVHYKDYYPIIREKITDKWQEYWLSLQSNKLRTIKTTVTPWNSSMEISRRLDVVLCRLSIEHTRLTHRHLIERTALPVCTTCHVTLTVRHLLAECARYSVERRRIYPLTAGMVTENIMKHILAERNGHYDSVSFVSYLNEIGVLSEL